MYRQFVRDTSNVSATDLRQTCESASFFFHAGLMKYDFEVQMLSIGRFQAFAIAASGIRLLIFRLRAEQIFVIDRVITFV